MIMIYYDDYAYAGASLLSAHPFAIPFRWCLFNSREISSMFFGVAKLLYHLKVIHFRIITSIKFRPVYA